MKRQILYVSQRGELWQVRRCGRPIALETSLEAALSTGRRLAFATSKAIPAELRIATGPGEFVIEGVYSQERVIELAA